MDTPVGRIGSVCAAGAEQVSGDVFITIMSRPTTMNWRFCPHCETQLDEATGICPACRWDPLEASPAAAAEPVLSLMERYRGTEYDSLTAMAPAMADRRPDGPTVKAKVLILAGVLTLFGLYGGMVAWTTIRDGMDQPVGPASIGAAR